ncbi:MAG TPA: hypothetical protein VGJ21_12200 [Terracidiphilus sp.]|jgi:hypothetical protein
MIRSRFFACVGLLAAVPLVGPQSSPTSYIITEGIAGAGPGATTTVYRDGTKILMETDTPAQGATPATRSLNLMDLQAHTTFSWDPAAKPITCGAGSFSGDWGDPFAMTAELNQGIAKGDFKPAGTETIAGVATQIYLNSSAQGSMKVWFDSKTALVMRAVATSAGAAPLTMIDIRKVVFSAPPAARFTLPPSCAGAKPPPSAADVIADETGDDGANYVNGMYGPGSQNACDVVLRVVNAKTLTPIDHIQVALDTNYKQEDPPHYEFGVAQDGTTTYSGGHAREITSRVHNGAVRIFNPPPYFMLGVNLIHPNHGGSLGLVYRQCFAPATVLLYVVKDYGQATESGDFLWVKAGKNAIQPKQ